MDKSVFYSWQTCLVQFYRPRKGGIFGWLAWVQIHQPLTSGNGEKYHQT